MTPLQIGFQIGIRIGGILGKLSIFIPRRMRLRLIRFIFERFGDSSSQYLNSEIIALRQLQEEKKQTGAAWTNEEKQRVINFTERAQRQGITLTSKQQRKLNDFLARE